MPSTHTKKTKEGKEKKQGKGSEDSSDPDHASMTPSPSPLSTRSKRNIEPNESQPTIDKHLKPVEPAGENLEATLKHLSSKLSEVASQSFIEDRLKQLVTEDFLRSTIKSLENEIKDYVKKEIDKVYKDVRQIKERVKEAENKVETIQSKMSDMETSIERLQEKNRKIAEDNKLMREQLQDRECLIRSQTNSINNLEQYTRKNSLRIYGVNDNNPKESPDDTAKQVINLVKSKLNIALTQADIDMTHRLGRFSADANRRIICKFISRFKRNDILRERRKLKNTSVIIREDLTLQNAKLLERTSVKECVKSAWSDQGKIIALLNNDRKVVVSSITDLDSL